MKTAILEFPAPQSCHDCKIMTHISELNGCQRWKENRRDNYISRHPDCPLKIKEAPDERRN